MNLQISVSSVTRVLLPLITAATHVRPETRTINVIPVVDITCTMETVRVLVQLAGINPAGRANSAMILQVRPTILAPPARLEWHTINAIPVTDITTMMENASPLVLLAGGPDPPTGLVNNAITPRVLPTTLATPAQQEMGIINVIPVRDIICIRILEGHV